MIININGQKTGDCKECGSKDVHIKSCKINRNEYFAELQCTACGYEGVIDKVNNVDTWSKESK